MSYYPFENQDKFFMYKSDKSQNYKFTNANSYVSLDNELNKKSEFYINNKDKTDFNKVTSLNNNLQYVTGYYDFISFENEIKYKK